MYINSEAIQWLLLSLQPKKKKKNNWRLQAVVMFSFPIPFSLCTMTCLIGSLMAVMLQYIVEGKLDLAPFRFQCYRDLNHRAYGTYYISSII